MKMSKIEKWLTKRFNRILVVTIILLIDGYILEKFNIRPILCFISTLFVYVWILCFYNYCLDLEIKKLEIENEENHN